jgi:hypothetical protein
VCGNRIETRAKKPAREAKMTDVAELKKLQKAIQSAQTPEVGISLVVFDLLPLY